MTALTALLIVIGTLCASFGTIAWLAIRLDPDETSLRFARRVATAGRWTASPGILLYLGHGGSHGTPMISVLLVAALAALATVITKANVPTTPAGTWPTTT